MSEASDCDAAPTAEHKLQLARLQCELDAVRQELQEFTYAVSHDLRAPLRHIKAFAQIIQEDLPDLPADLAGHLATIGQSAQLLTLQLDGLTALSRLALQPVKLVPVDTRLLLLSVVDELTQLCAPRVLQWQMAAEWPTLQADTGLLRQVLAQVLDNACKFTRSRNPALISLSWTPSTHGRCSLNVQDNGVGFQSEQAGQLFKVFARLHPAREFDGLGLGLVSCRRMLARINGDIGISAAPGAGCLVCIGLPM